MGFSKFIDKTKRNCNSGFTFEDVAFSYIYPKKVIMKISFEPINQGCRGGVIIKKCEKLN